MPLSANMQSKGYSIEKIGSRVNVFQHGEYVASLSPMMFSPERLGFDWHRVDQWHLRSRDLEG